MAEALASEREKLDAQREAHEFRSVLEQVLPQSLTTLRTAAEIRQQVRLLAHYTSLKSLESVLKSEQVWFSSPLLMNDLQKMNFGIEAGIHFVLNSPTLESVLPEHTIRVAKSWFYGCAQEFHNHHAADVYVFCLTNHDHAPPTGQLSMWRAYGEPGQGAALVFNTNWLTENESSPLFPAQVTYQSHVERHQSLLIMVEKWKAAIQRMSLLSPTDAQIKGIVHSLFISIKFLALTTKHEGFKEENEWRLIYMPDHDIGKVLAPHFSYHIGPRGLEPKLKLPIRPIGLNPPSNWTLDNIIETIVLGPGMNDHLRRRAITRMLIALGKESLIDRLAFSDIPLRQ